MYPMATVIRKPSGRGGGGGELGGARGSQIGCMKYLTQDMTKAKKEKKRKKKKRQNKTKHENN